jgi:hypothetical protein
MEDPRIKLVPLGAAYLVFGANMPVPSSKPPKSKRRTNQYTPCHRCGKLTKDLVCNACASPILNDPAIRVMPDFSAGEAA